MADSNQTPFDKNKLAVALAYNREKDQAPRVAAKGKGAIAQAIIDMARQHGVEVREDSDLAGLLATLELDTPIPVEAYAAVAEILSYIYKMNDKAKRGGA